jgi:Protein of unknown function (DUF2752)
MQISWRCVAPNESDQELIWLTVSIASILGGGAWLVLGLPWPRCPFLAVTGLPCLTCGATRSMIAFLHGDFLLALRWNPLAFVAFCGLIAFDFYASIVILGRTARLRVVGWTGTERNLARIALVSLLALNWIYLLSHHARY